MEISCKSSIFQKKKWEVTDRLIFVNYYINHPFLTDIIVVLILCIKLSYYIK